MIKADLGDALQARRKTQGLSIETLAAQAGVHRTTISRWERGKTVPFVSELTSVLDALKVSLKERQVFYRYLEVPRAVQIADVGAAATLPVSSGELLRALRQRAGIAQRAVAQAVGVTQSLVVKWEKGECWPSSEHLHAFCFAIGATEDELAFLTTRAWRHTDPLPLDKDALDDAAWKVSDNPTLPGTYLVFAARYHDLYRAGKISEVEATAAYGYYAHHLGCVLNRQKEARQAAAPVLAGLARSRGKLSMGQIMAIDWQVECGDTPSTNDLNAPIKRRLNRNLEGTLALLSALRERYPARFRALRNHQIARTWERAGQNEAAEVHYRRSITSAMSEEQATHRSYAYVEFLCRRGQFQQAASQLRPPSSWAWETRPMVHVKNWSNYAEVCAGLGDFAVAEGYLARAITHAHQYDIWEYVEPECLRIARILEKTRRGHRGRAKSGRHPSQENTAIAPK